MAKDKMIYTLDILHRVSVAKWRIDDPHDLDNAEWSLAVYDRNLQKWINVNDLKRPGEDAQITSINVIDE